VQKYLGYSLIFAAGYLAHILYSSIYFTTHHLPKADFDYKRSSSFYNSQNEICNFLNRKGCDCNIVIESQQACEAELDNYFIQKMYEKGRQKKQ